MRTRLRPATAGGIAEPLRHLRRLLLLILLTACAGPTDAPRPEVRSVTVLQAGRLVQTLQVELSAPAPLVVEYWTEGGPRLRLRSPEAASHAVPLTRLRAGRSYDFELVGFARSGTLTTDPLPEDLARIEFTARGSPTVPLVLLHLFEPDGFRGYAILDAEGEVVWYWRTQDFPFGMTRRQSGNFVFLDRGRGLVEVTPAGDVVHLLPQDTVQREMHHDVLVTPENSLLFIAFDNREVDGRRLKGEAIWEWSPETGGAVKRWSAWDHLSPSRDRGPRFGAEWLHANALAIGPRRNVLLSLHYLNQVISITQDWNRLEWRLGGVNATITTAGGAQFSGQHTAREIAPQRVILFDNGLERADHSRVIEYALEGATARVVSEWKATPANFAAIVSSARRLGNGNTLVGFGTSRGVQGSTGPVEVYEVTPGGEARWHLVVENVRIMYRAEPLTAISSEEVTSP